MRALVVASAVALLAVAGAAQARGATPAAPPNFLQLLDVKSARTVFAVGESVFLRTRDGGQTWERHRVPAVRVIAGAAFVNSSVWLVAGASSGNLTIPIVRSSDGGATWSRSLLPRRYPDGYGAVAFSLTDARHGWLTVDTVHSTATANVDLYRTDDGGASWRYLDSHPFTGTILFSGSRGWALGGPEPNRLYTTTDAGSSWTQAALPVPASLRGETATLALPQPLTVTGVHLALPAWYAKPVGIRKTRNTVVVYRSDDGGKHWLATTPVYDSGFGNYGIGTPIPVAFTDRAHWTIAAGLRLYRSVDGGRHWRSLVPDARATGLGALIGITQLAFPTSRVGYGLIEYGHCREFKRDCTERSFVLRSSNGGASWTLLSLEGPLGSFPRCRADQLTASAGFGGATGSALGGAAIRNTSGSACSLPARPTIRILLHGQPLPLRESAPRAAASFPQVPVRLLRPGRSAYVTLQWFNWCGVHTSGPAQINVEVGIGSARPVVAHATDAVLPRCDAPSRRSMLWVGKFVESP